MLYANRCPWHLARATESCLGCGRNSVGRVLASQANCRGFKSLRPLQLSMVRINKGYKSYRWPLLFDVRANMGRSNRRPPNHPCEQNGPTLEPVSLQPLQQRRFAQWALTSPRPPSMVSQLAAGNFQSQAPVVSLTSTVGQQSVHVDEPSSGLAAPKFDPPFANRGSSQGDAVPSRTSPAPMMPRTTIFER